MLPPATRPRILLVDDDATIREHLGPVLERNGLEVTTAIDGADALRRISSRRPDLVILDVLMPVLDGRETLRRIRAEGDWLPVILLTEVGETFERAAALDEGADDYLTKPFDPLELLARIRAVLRRSIAGVAPLSAAEALVAGNVRLERPARRVLLDGRERALTPRAFALLEFLMSHPDEVFSRERLMERVWGFESIVTTRAVDHRIAEIRRVLEDDPSTPIYLETVPGTGYRFLAAVERA
ncbi:MULTISPECIES: response regulator transcription factor [unclassified Brachybacterium]|uniref:response regulator transcription factor n=1 Tax=unclassified Brachybacterium TaxID=2623841 RepID=UPI000C80D362|nr:MULTISPECIES: response regulator transcription factor [unclassified Brachybacterium]PMC75720.1 DNA-binding response regulator [Brachybacterium sp. UMB0905]